MQVRGVAPMRFNHESKTFARLSRQNTTESVGVARNVTDGPQSCVVESNAGSLQERTPRIKGTQRHGKFVIAENAVNDHRVNNLQSFSNVKNSELWS